MSQTHAFTVSLLDASAAGIAAAAASRIGGPDPEGAGDGRDFRSAREHLFGRISVLAEALHFEAPEIVAADARWNLETHRAREAETSLLEQCLEALHDELANSLPTTAATHAQQYIQLGLRELRGGEATPVESYLEPGPHAETARALLLATLEGRTRDAESVLTEAMDTGADFVSLHHEVILPVQAEVGRLWQAGQIHVAVEHLTSQVIERSLSVLRSRAPRVNSVERTVLVSSIEGNRHQIGGRILADQFEREGWTSIYLGADTPSGDLLESIEHWKPDLVALSIGLWVHLRPAEQLISRIRGLGSPVKVLVGGRPLTEIPRLWESLGADGSAGDAASAVALGTSLLLPRSP